MAASEDPDDISSISWPGFVDIMSSVIMMFIFFVLITSVALYFHTLTYKSKVLSQIAQMTEKSVQQQNQQMQQENTQMKQQLQTVTEENMKLQAKIAEIEDKTKKSDSKFAKSEEQQVSVDAAEGRITLFFGRDSISLTEDTLQKFTDFVNAYLAKGGDPAHLYVDIEGSKEVFNDNEGFAQEIATARLMNARNIILKTPIPKDHIMVNIVPSAPIEDKTDWVTVRIRQQ